MIKLLHGDCLAQMKTLDDNSVDSIVSDPPYGISFMAKKWDYDVPSVEVWKEAMRVLKPGGHALIACGTRTQHRMVCNIEDAGFEIRDVVSWIYGSGFPKSLNISKAIDKAAGAEREVVGKSARHGGGVEFASGCSGFNTDVGCVTAPATEAAKQWDGWGTALKPACEFFTLARKPLSEKTVAANVLKWGTGGINIDGCRVEAEPNRPMTNGNKEGKNIGGSGNTIHFGIREKTTSNQGRFPANLIHDGSQEVLDLFPETKPNESAARFFYCPKASKKDRNDGCEELEDKSTCEHEGRTGQNNSASRPDGSERKPALSKNNHPTVKPTALMAYLCRLITPTGGVVLDPYMGSGSTGKAAVREGFSFVGCELDEDYFQIAKSRVENAYYQ